MLNSGKKFFYFPVILLLIGLHSMAYGGDDLGFLGVFPKWSKVEIELTGPDMVGLSASDNPFLIDVYITFTGPAGASFIIPAFYDGDGFGNLDGDVWKVRFSPDATGQWSFSSNSANPLLSGYTGTFEVSEPTGCQAYIAGGLPNFACSGRLNYTGEHFLKFADGGYWLKGGTNDPEDFLAPGQNAGFNNKQEAVDYLAAKGVNALYFMSNNVGGDKNNVWPWVGSDAAEAQTNHEYFDVAKLAEWESIFTYIQNKGIVLHFVLEDDSGWTGFNRSLYYREMVARFGHHNGLIWNIAEEFNERYSADQVKNFAEMLSNFDAYGHPLTVLSRWTHWQPFLGDENIDLTSFHSQDFPAQPENDKAEEWFFLVESSGKTIPTSWDEATRGLTGSDRSAIRHIIWATYMGGANLEIYVSKNVDYNLFADPFDDMTRARGFLESLPFNEMSPDNSLLTGGTGYVFNKPGENYCVYLPNGGQIELDLSATTNTFWAAWFNPRDASIQEIANVPGGSFAQFSAPDENDWVLSLNYVQTSSCPGDIEGSADGDVDGADLAAYIADRNGISPEEFAADFGRTDCL